MMRGDFRVAIPNWGKALQIDDRVEVKALVSAGDSFAMGSEVTGNSRIKTGVCCETYVGISTP